MTTKCPWQLSVCIRAGHFAIGDEKYQTNLLLPSTSLYSLPVLVLLQARRDHYPEVRPNTDQYNYWIKSRSTHTIFAKKRYFYFPKVILLKLSLPRSLKVLPLFFHTVWAWPYFYFISIFIFNINIYSIPGLVLSALPENQRMFWIGFWTTILQYFRV